MIVNICVTNKWSTLSKKLFALAKAVPEIKQFPKCSLVEINCSPPKDIKSQ